ncbi:putative reverse transcriptase zinc-binding domain-containing protein [Arabidopsis thaliana]
MGTGGNIWFWYDNWTPMGPLIRYLGDSGPSCLRILLSARVANAYNNVGWLLAPPRSDMALSLHIHLSTIPLPADSDGEDVFGWFVDGKLCGNFTASKTWEALRPRDTVKDWAPLIWFKGSTPRHAFNMWVSNLDRLPTLARLAAWGLQGSVLCGFCSASTETRDHIFLLCPFTKVIWSLICQRLGLSSSSFASWDSLMAWTRVRNLSSPRTLRLLLTQALVYTVWRQRNNLMHNQIRIPPQAIFKDIDRQIINSITARRHLKNFRSLMQHWLY